MWSSFSNKIQSLGRKKNFVETSRPCLEFSDDETSSNANAEEGLECPICCESFNIVENVPYVLWCGHTLCKNCVLGLSWAALEFSNQQIRIPFFISCPWCHLFTLRLVCNGNLKFPRKNFFLLWMIESLNGDRMKSPLSISGNHPSIWSPRSPSAFGNQFNNNSLRRTSLTHRLGRSGTYSNNDSHANTGLNVERTHPSLHKFFHFTTKFPLVIILLLIVGFALPASATILVLYLIITVFFAIPSFLLLYFAFPGLDWLVREITS